MDTKKYYLKLKTGLQDASNNVAEFMLGNIRPSGEHVKCKEDLVYDALVEPSVYDSNRKAMNRNWSNQKANPALKTKAGNT